MRSATSMWSLCLMFQRLFPSSGINVMSVMFAFAVLIHTVSSHSSHQLLTLKTWSLKCQTLIPPDRLIAQGDFIEYSESFKSHIYRCSQKSFILHKKENWYLLLDLFYTHIFFSFLHITTGVYFSADKVQAHFLIAID